MKQAVAVAPVGRHNGRLEQSRAERSQNPKGPDGDAGQGDSSQRKVEDRLLLEDVVLLHPVAADPAGADGRAGASGTLQVVGARGNLRLPIMLTHTKIVCVITTWLRRRAR